KPVRIALTMEEQFYTITKHGATVRLKTGVRKDGRIAAREVEVWWNGGAYADIGPRVTQKSGLTSSGPYDIENISIDSHAVYTNEPPAGALRGRGIAIGIKSCVAPTTSVAMVNIYGDGSCGICCSTVDMGQGSDTAMAQIAAEILGVSAESIRVVHPDTDVTPYDMATLGSRSTYHMGNAVRRAAEDARAQLLRMAATVLKTAEGDLECREGVIVAQSGAHVTFRDLMVARFAMQAGNI